MRTKIVRISWFRYNLDNYAYNTKKSKIIPGLLLILALKAIFARSNPKTQKKFSKPKTNGVFITWRAHGCAVRFADKTLPVLRHAQNQSCGPFFPQLSISHLPPRHQHSRNGTNPTPHSTNRKWIASFISRAMAMPTTAQPVDSYPNLKFRCRSPKLRNITPRAKFASRRSENCLT